MSGVDEILSYKKDPNEDYYGILNCDQSATVRKIYAFLRCKESSGFFANGCLKRYFRDLFGALFAGTSPRQSLKVLFLFNAEAPQGRSCCKNESCLLP